MDSLEIPAGPTAPALTPLIRTPRPPRIWKFWGTALWGLFIFAGMFVVQIAVVAWFVLRRRAPIDGADAIRRVREGGVSAERCRRRAPRRRRGADDFTLRDHGPARGASGAVDRDTDLAHAVYRVPRAAPALMDRAFDRGRRAVCSGHGVGPAVARGGTRDCSRLHGRG